MTHYLKHPKLGNINVLSADNYQYLQLSILAKTTDQNLLSSLANSLRKGLWSCGELFPPPKQRLHQLIGPLYIAISNLSAVPFTEVEYMIT